MSENSRLAAWCTLVATVALGSCNVDTAVSEEAQISCASNADCPDDWVCAGTRCTNPSVNDPPTVTLAAIDRQVGVVTLGLTLFDREADHISFQAQVERDGTWEDIALFVDGAPLSFLQGSAEGSTYELTWNAQSHLSAVDLSARSGERYRTLRLRVTPNDGVASGATATVTFVYGNDAPEVVALSLDDAVVSQLVVMRVSVSDTSADPIRITSLELDTGSGFESIPLADLDTFGRNVHFPSGALEGLSTNTEGGLEHSFTWRSDAFAPLDASAATLRVTVADSYEGSEPFTLAASFVIDNGNSPPSVVIDTDLAAATQMGVVQFYYILDDGDLDEMDVEVEYFDPRADPLGGWHTALSAESNDQTSDLFPGTYSFSWQSAQMGSVNLGGVRLRVTATDAAGATTTAATSAFDVTNENLGGNLPPALFWGAPARTTSRVSMPLTVTDANNDIVDITPVEAFWTTAGVFSAATLVVDSGEGCNDPSALTSSLNGVTHTLCWDAAVQIGTSGYDGNMRLRATPHDGTAAGSLAQSAAFAFGNDAPVITAVSVDPNLDGNKVGGNAVVRFVASDSSSDTVSIESFVIDGTPVTPLSVGLGGNFPSGSLQSLPTNVGSGVPHSFVWASLNTHVISQVLQLQIRLQDSLGALSTYSTSVAVNLQNANRPPAITINSFVLQGSPLTTIMNYTVADPEDDVSGLSVFYLATGTGASTGTTLQGRVATASETTNLGPGTYTLEWDSTQLGPGTFNVTLEARLADGTNPAVVAFTQSLPIDTTSLNASPFVLINSIVPADAASNRVVTSANITMIVIDGNRDMVTLAPQISVFDSQSHTYGAYLPLNLTGPTQYTLQASPEGEPNTFANWNLTLQSGLTTKLNVLDVESGSSETQVVPTKIRVRVVPTDSFGKVGVGAAIEMLVGNDPPKGSMLQFSFVLSGEVGLPYRLSDEDRDDAEIAFFWRRASSSDSWRTFRAPALPPLVPTTLQAVGAEASIRWDTCREPPLYNSGLSIVEVYFEARDNPPWSAHRTQVQSPTVTFQINNGTSGCMTGVPAPYPP